MDKAVVEKSDLLRVTGVRNAETEWSALEEEDNQNASERFVSLIIYLFDQARRTEGAEVASLLFD